MKRKLSVIIVMLKLTFTCLSLDTNTRYQWLLLGPGEGAFIHDIEFAGNDVWVTSDASGIFKSENDGLSWQPRNNGLSNEGLNIANIKHPVFFYRIPMLQLEIDPTNSQNMYAFSDYCFVRSRDGGKHWDKTLINTTARDLKMRGAEKSYRFCLDPSVSGRIFLMRYNGDFFQSNDYGKSFHKISSIKGTRPLWYGLQIFDYKTLKVDPFSPVDNRTLYFCCGDGFYISKDNGKNWVKKVDGLHYTECISFDYLNKDNKLQLFMTIPGRSLRRVKGKRYCGGIYTTTPEDDFKWKKLDVKVAGKPVNFNRNLYGILLTDKKSNTVYTVNSIGKGPDILFSRDYGKNWNPICINSNNFKSPGWIYHPDKLANINKFAFNPRKPDELWLRSWRYGLLKSSDLGKSWKNVYSNVQDGCYANRGLHTYWGLSCLPDQIAPNRIYIGVTDFGPCVSNDNGVSWKLLHPPSTEAFIGMKTITDNHEIKNSNDPFFTPAPDSGWKKLNVKTDWQAMEFDANDPNCFYVIMGLGNARLSKNKLHRESVLLKTPDRGESFYAIKPGKTTGLPPFTSFCDLLSLPATSKHPNQLWVSAAWEGVYSSVDGGKTFSLLKDFKNEFKLGDFNAAEMALDPNDPNRIYLCCGTNKLRANADHTKTKYVYNSQYFTDFTFQSCIPELIDSGKLRATIQGALWVTPDRGKTWQKLTNDFADVRNLQVAPHDSNILYMGVVGHLNTKNVKFMKGGVYKSLDRGKNWQLVLDQPMIADIAVHPIKKNWIFAAAVGWPGTCNPGCVIGAMLDQQEMEKAKPGVYFSKDGGLNWQNISGNLKYITHTLNRMTLKKWKPDSLFISTSSGILRLDIGN